MENTNKLSNAQSINLCEKQIEGLPMESICFPQKESSISSSSEASTSCPICATSPKRQRIDAEQKYWEMKEKRAAEKIEILREYTSKKLEKMDEAERGRESRFARKEKLLRELFNKP